MQTFFIVAILVLGFLITFQIAKASEYVAIMRGEERSRKQTNKINAFLLLVFLIAGIIAFVIAITTMGYQAFRAANVDPVKSLKSE